MLLVKTSLGKSGVHGIGLFAEQFIPRGTVTWRYVAWYDSSFTVEDFEKMSEPGRRLIQHYTYLDKKTNRYVLCADDQRFINHSKDQLKINIDSTPDEDVALRDIQLGEELLCDYNKFDDTYFSRLNIGEADLK